ncbi:MAG: hypothetical protein Q7K43_05805 [Candidatus Woesearchaeota archaeon]|nr:hypothetical protein [Candidatus Woesearchaeota archaeon]
MRSFEDLLNAGQVRKASVDKELAKSLVEQAFRQYAHAEKDTITDENRDFVLSDYYEAVRMLVDALIALSGYKAYSHEATVVFLAKDKDFPPVLSEGFDRMRRLRNDLHYYGKRIEIADAQDARDMAHTIVLKLRKKISTLLTQAI